MSGKDGDPPPIPQAIPGRRRKKSSNGKNTGTKMTPLSTSGAIFPPPVAGPSSDQDRNTEKNEDSTPRESEDITEDLYEKKYIHRDLETPKKQKRNKPKKKRIRRLTTAVNEFLQDVVDTIEARDRFNERSGLVMDEESVGSSTAESVRAPLDPSQSIFAMDPVERFKFMVESNEQYLRNKTKKKRFMKRLPDRDTSNLQGQIRAKLDFLCMKLGDKTGDTVESIDDARLTVWRKIRDMADGIKQKGGRAVLGKAFMMFGDIMREVDEVRYPITSTPVYPGHDVPDPWAAFRYLEECAAGQGISVCMEKYRLITYEDNRLSNILDIVDPNCQDELGQSIVHLAAQYCNPNSLDKMIDSGYKINLEDCQGFTPLFYAVIANNCKAITTLIKSNADINHRSKCMSRQPIHIAAQFGAMEALKLLLEWGVSIDSLDENHHTPIIIACYYSHSDISAFLLEEGANPCIEDVHGVMGAMRIAYVMPTITREVFNQFVSEDIYQGERYFKLDRMIGSSGETNTSFYHYLVWLANMGLIEHAMFERLTAAKWDLYGESRAKIKLLVIGVYLTIWSLEFVLPHSNYTEPGFTFKFMDGLFLLMHLTALVSYVLRFKQNLRLLRQRYGYTAFLNQLFNAQYHEEMENLHFKGKNVELSLKRKYGTNNITFLDDVKSSPALVMDFVVDNMLVLYLILNFSCGFTGNIADPTFHNETQTTVGFVSWVDIYGAITIMGLWVTCFAKLQITEKIGPFVVYMRYCGRDLHTIGLMFTALYIPAFCVFYKTVYANQHSGDWFEDMFLVLRMVLIDYDYDKGMEDAPVKWWWMFGSMTWIIVSSIVILNLLIALMADSYSRIYETAELYARIERARFIMEYERTLPRSVMEEYNDNVRINSPQIVTFDPVCDRDKVSVIEETVDGLSKKFDKLEKKLETTMMKQICNRLDTIDQALTLYTFHK